MKLKIVTLFLVVIGLFVCCNAIDKLLTFTVTNETNFTINSGLPLNSPIDVPSPDVTTNSSTQYNNNNTRADLVKDVKLTELKITITNPANKNFSFLKAIHLYIATDGSDEIELAYLDNINSTANTLNLTCTSAKLDKYVRASSYKLRTRVTTDETLSQSVDIKANMTFKVTADPL